MSARIESPVPAGADTTAVITAARRSRGRPRISWLLGFLPLVVLLVGWQLLGGNDPLRFPQPSRWFPALAALHESGVLLPAFGHSLVTFLLGLGCAIVVGVTLGLVIGSLPRVDRALSPLFDFLRGLPVPVLVPVTILLLGVGLGPSVFIVAFAIVWPILLNTALSRRTISPVRMDTARIFRLGPVATLTKIVIPSVFPSSMVGIRIAASLGIITTLVVEMIVSSGGRGAGFLLMERQARFDSAGMWGVLLLIGVFGFLINLLLGLIERRVLRNHPGVGEA